MKEFLTSNCSRILMYEGLSGYGKSQILMEIEYLSQVRTTDLSVHINELNLKLQGFGKSIDIMFGYIKAFESKVKIFKRDVETKTYKYFPRVTKYFEKASAAVQNEMELLYMKYQHVLDSLLDQFSDRFSQFRDLEQTMKIIKYPDVVIYSSLELNGFQWMQIDDLEMQLAEFQDSIWAQVFVDLRSKLENLERTIAIALTKISFHQNFYTIQILMANVLGLDACKHYKERQTNIQNKVKTLLDEKFHCIFNDIFHVQFPTSREVSKMSILRKQKQLEALFMKILERTVKQERVIFIIDEAQFVDTTSWAFLEKLIQTVPIFIIMSLSPFLDMPCEAANAIIKNRNTTYVTIGAVQPSDIRNKVCLDLNVKGIPKELDLYLVEGSCGIPFYCEELLKNLDQHRVLVFQPIQSEEKANVTWNNLFKNVAKPTELLKPFTLSSDGGSEEVCKLASGVRLKNLSPPASLKEISLVQLDSMSLSHQMLVRCAAIIGLTFTTELLFEILPCWNMKRMINALATLVESNIFDCFRNGKELRKALKQNSASFEVYHRSSSLKPAEGRAHRESEALRELESEVIECHIIRFCRPMMQKTAYELWLKDQKVDMHLKCARFLEENATAEEDIFSKIEIMRKSEMFSENSSKNEAVSGRHHPLGVVPVEEILEVAVMPLAYHFLALGENSKALYYFLEAASAYLILEDNYMAYTYLNEGERLLKILKKEKSWSHTFESATFYGLKGQVCFNMGQMVLAKKMLKKSLKLLNRTFPFTFISMFFYIHVEKNKHHYYMNQQTPESSPPGKKQLAELHQQVNCFSLLWKIYSLNYFFHYKYYAYLAALMEVNSALETQDDFQIIKAYLDYSLLEQLAIQSSTWYKYEIMAMEMILNLPLKAEGIEIMAYMADTLGSNKFLMGHLDLAIDLGSRAQKMWGLLRNPYKQYKVLCWLSRSLCLKIRHKQLIQVLGWLWDLSVAEEHIICKAFFYFICLDIMLYSGFVYRTFSECLEFIQENEDNRILKFQSGILLGLHSCVAIWYARLQEWDDFQIVFNKTKNLVPRRTPTALYFQGICRYLEAQVLHLQKQIEGQSEYAQDSGVELLKNLESTVAQNTTGPIFLPRMYHLMAYVCILMGDGQNCDLFLNTALQLAENHGNMLEMSWLSLNREWWYSNSDLNKDQWLQIVVNLPTWESILSGKVNVQDIQKNKFLMKVNILDNPF
ncbi:hypothetical protein QTO34_011685 [Cnephaeus nilssonii]|uniref:Adenylate cyclase type 10 n=1 Tax=Cnephaeus nilssonii TaxID=3371016 RepID=A0AA40HEY3_CNENI|nr:hypothetical protein QTO34_011685 [Eptesicus nilssonii]